MQTGTARPAFEPRHEYKYYIGDVGYARLRPLISAVLRRDRYGDSANNEYMVRSLYFDDAFDSAYFEKMGGVSDRKKYRIRIYNNSDEFIYLECKYKQDYYISKDSVRITRRLAEQIMSGRPDGLHSAGHPLIRQVFAEIRLNGLRPAVVVDYAREAYTHPAENIRLTFDKRLHSSMYNFDIFDPDLPLISPMDDGRTILEVKYDNYLPDYIRELLGTTVGESSAISKYVLCRRYHMLAE